MIVFHLSTILRPLNCCTVIGAGVMYFQLFGISDEMNNFLIFFQHFKQSDLMEIPLDFSISAFEFELDYMEITNSQAILEGGPNFEIYLLRYYVPLIAGNSQLNSFFMRDLISGPETN